MPWETGLFGLWRRVRVFPQWGKDGFGDGMMNELLKSRSGNGIWRLLPARDIRLGGAGYQHKT